jgi:superfamily II DNA helicase RecQ
MLGIIAQTGSGKSAIPLTVGTLLTGVVITLVPMIGLVSVQVANVEVYHVGEHRGKDAAKLRHRLDIMTEQDADYVTIFLYMSPQSLQTNSPWYGVLRRIAMKNFIRLICIDEAHTVHQDSCFRPEFDSAVGTL